MREWIRGGRLSSGRMVDLVVTGGEIEAVVDHDPTASFDSHLHGWLLLPPMTEPHAHLDKALTAEAVRNPTGDLEGAVNAWRDAAEAGMFTSSDVTQRATAAIERLLTSGVTALRTHVNTTPEAGADNVHALRKVRQSFAGMIDMQIVALTSSPMTGPGSEPNRAALAAAIDAGADVIGGCPHLGDRAAESVRYAFEVASDAGLPIDLHTDETLDPSVLTVLDMVESVESLGFDGLVAASHCVSLGVQEVEEQREIAARIAAAGVAVLPQPQTNLYLQGRDDEAAAPRGLTALHALLDAGVLVAAGADNVQDPYNLVGRSDPLETAALLVMAGHVSPEQAYAMVSNNGRRAMGLAPVGFSPGDPADFIAIDAPSVRAAIADAPSSRRVYRAGHLVATADQQTQIHRRESE